MNFKQEAAAKAITLINENDIVGLGAGSTMAYAVAVSKRENSRRAYRKAGYFFIYNKAIIIERKPTGFANGSIKTN